MNSRNSITHPPRLRKGLGHRSYRLPSVEIRDFGFLNHRSHCHSSTQQANSTLDALTHSVWAVYEIGLVQAEHYHCATLGGRAYWRYDEIVIWVFMAIAIRAISPAITSFFRESIPLFLNFD